MKRLSTTQAIKPVLLSVLMHFNEERKQTSKSISLGLQVSKALAAIDGSGMWAPMDTGGVHFNNEDLNDIWISGRHDAALDYFEDICTVEQTAQHRGGVVWSNVDLFIEEYNAALSYVGSQERIIRTSEEAKSADEALSNLNFDDDDHVSLCYDELRELLIDIQS